MLSRSAKFLLLSVLFLTINLRYSSAQVTETGNSNAQGTRVICVSGCSAGSTIPDNGTVAGGTSVGSFINLNYLWNGANWVRLIGDSTNGLKVQCTTGCSGTTLGQSTMSASLPVAIASDQSAFPVTNTNLDVALSTRLKPADTLTAVTTVGTITNPVAVSNTSATVSPVAARITDGTNFLGTSANPLITNFPTGSSAAVSVNGYNGGSSNSFGAGTSGLTTQRTISASDDPVVTNTAPFLLPNTGAYVRQDSTNTIARENGNLQYLVSQFNQFLTDLQGSIIPRPNGTPGLFLRSGLSGQAVSLANPLPVVISTPDPCNNRKLNAAVSQTATTRYITGRPGTYIAICYARLVTGAAEILNLLEGTGANCGTGTSAISGSTTAANGESYAANGGFSGGGSFTIAATQILGDDFCIGQSGSNRVSGNITYVFFQP